MGRASGIKDGLSCSYVVGRYKEAGNVGGKYKKNVFKGSFSIDMCKKIDGLIKDIPSKISAGNNNGDKNVPSENTDNVDSSKGNASGNSLVPFDENGLHVHNIFRNIHGSVKMTIDPGLSRDAELYAKELSKTGNLKHALLDNVGENLAYGCSSEPNYELSATEATKRW